MKAAYNWLAARDGYVVTVVGALLGTAMAFGVEFSAEQTVSIVTAVTALVSLILGRPVKYPPAG
jgi:uncharacterized membrane protein